MCLILGIQNNHRLWGFKVHDSEIKLLEGPDDSLSVTHFITVCHRLTQSQYPTSRCVFSTVRILKSSGPDNLWWLHLRGKTKPVAGCWPRSARECPGMSPSCGKYLAFQRCERATLTKRKETSAPLMCLATLLWKWNRFLSLTCATLYGLWCVCLCR